MKLLIIAVIIIITMNITGKTLPRAMTPEEREYAEKIRQAEADLPDHDNMLKYLPRGMTAEEAAFVKKHGYINRHPSNVGKSDAVLRITGDYESCTGIVVSWSAHYELVSELIRIVAERYPVYVTYYGDADWVTWYLDKKKVNLKNVRMLSFPTDSMWMGDYGPVWAVDQDGYRHIIDNVYLPTRKNDDVFADTLSYKLGNKAHYTDLIISRNCAVFDGRNTVFLADTKLGMTKEDRKEQDRLIKQRLGIKNIIRLTVPEGFDSLDNHLVFVNESCALVSSFKDKKKKPFARVLDSIEKTVSNCTARSGQKYHVARLPAIENGISYASALFVNKLVIIPSYNVALDKEAFNAYKRHLPDHEIVQLDCRLLSKLGGGPASIAAHIRKGE